MHKMEFVRYLNNLNKDDLDIQQALGFRRDTHQISYGDVTSFDDQECVSWFESLMIGDNGYFEHVLLDGRVVGQLEYRSGMVAEEGERFGYINHIYLIPTLRGKGLGAILFNHMLSQFERDACQCIYLRYMTTNILAGAFYKKHGWEEKGIATDRGQLMQLYLADSSRQIEHF